jgi:hypothetical protein
MESNIQKTTSQNSEKITEKKIVNKKSPKMFFGVLTLIILVIGGLVGLYLTEIGQDLRQQADLGDYQSGCTIGSCPAGQTCHCQDGNACTITACEDDDLIRNCEEQGRSYCVNVYGQSNTCCAVGYKCCANSNGCCSDSGPTKPPNPTTPPGTPTPTTPPGTPTPTIPITTLTECGKTPCSTDLDCLGSELGVICVTADSGDNYCSFGLFQNACKADPNPVNCCTAGPTPTASPTPTITPTPTPTSTPTPTITPTITPTPVISECGYTPCATNNDCEEDLICVIVSDDEKYCSKEEYKDSCIENPGIEACCNEPTPTEASDDDDSSSSYSYSESNSSATVNINNENTTTVAGGTATNRYAPTEPTLPPELPRSGPEDWIQYLQIGLGTLGIGALLLLFL